VTELSTRYALPADVALADEEAALVRALLRRDRKATEEFVARFSNPVYSYLQRRLSPHIEEVEDCFQQVFLAAWQSLDTYRGEHGLKAWLLGIARHKIQDVYRARLRLGPWIDDDQEAHPGAEPPEQAGLMACRHP